MTNLEAWYVFWQVAPFGIVALGAGAVWLFGSRQVRRQQQEAKLELLEEFVLNSGR